MTSDSGHIESVAARTVHVGDRIAEYGFVSGLEQDARDLGTVIFHIGLPPLRAIVAEDEIDVGFSNLVRRERRWGDMLQVERGAQAREPVEVPAKLFREMKRAWTVERDRVVIRLSLAHRRVLRRRSRAERGIEACLSLKTSTHGPS